MFLRQQVPHVGRDKSATLHLHTKPKTQSGRMSPQRAVIDIRFRIAYERLTSASRLQHFYYTLSPQFGVLLLVRHQERRWTIDGKRTDDISLLRSWLQAKATSLAAEQGKTVHVAVIDMLLPTARRRAEGESPVSRLAPSEAGKSKTNKTDPKSTATTHTAQKKTASRATKSRPQRKASRTRQ